MQSHDDLKILRFSLLFFLATSNKKFLRILMRSEHTNKQSNKQTEAAITVQTNTFNVT